MNDDPDFEKAPPNEARGELNPPPRKPPTAVGAAAPQPSRGPGRTPPNPEPTSALALAKMAAFGLALVAYGVAVILISHHVVLIAMGVVFAAAGLVMGYFALGWRSPFLLSGHRGWHILRTRFGPDLRAAFRSGSGGAARRGARRRHN